MIREEKDFATALRELSERWRLGDAEMAALCHVEETVYRGWISASPSAHQGTLPSGAQCAASLLSIARRLAEKHPQVEAQVEWLTTAHPHFDSNRPLDVALSSPENLLWLAYYLESSAAGAE